MKHILVDISELRDASDFAGIDGFGEHSAYLSLETGRICYHSDSNEAEDEEQLPDDIDEPGKYLQIPDKNALGLGKPLALRFAAECLSEEYDTVRAIFSRRGAYARFKDLLAAKDRLEQWYGYERDAAEAALRAWCEANGVGVVG